jgi:hypothetical protein
VDIPDQGDLDRAVADAVRLDRTLFHGVADDLLCA